MHAKKLHMEKAFYKYQKIHQTYQISPVKKSLWLHSHWSILGHSWSAADPFCLAPYAQPCAPCRNGPCAGPVRCTTRGQQRCWCSEPALVHWPILSATQYPAWKIWSPRSAACPHLSQKCGDVADFLGTYNSNNVSMVMLTQFKELRWSFFFFIFLRDFSFSFLVMQPNTLFSHAWTTSSLGKELSRIHTCIQLIFLISQFYINKIL